MGITSDKNETLGLVMQMICESTHMAENCVMRESLLHINYFTSFSTKVGFHSEQLHPALFIGHNPMLHVGLTQCTCVGLMSLVPTQKLRPEPQQWR